MGDVLKYTSGAKSRFVAKALALRAIATALGFLTMTAAYGAEAPVPAKTA